MRKEGGTKISTALNPSKRAQISALECSKLIRALVIVNPFLTYKYVHIYPKVEITNKSNNKEEDNKTNTHTHKYTNPTNSTLASTRLIRGTP